MAKTMKRVAATIIIIKMSYTKLNLDYEVITAKGKVKKHKKVFLNKKVTEYGDKYGYDKIKVMYQTNNVLIKYNDEVLMNQVFSGLVSGDQLTGGTFSWES